MQDNYFSKIQGGSSLFMKSDHDGANDAHNRNMPLGIKTVGQGIETFTDWQGISDCLEERKLANFEDNDINHLRFSQSIYAPVLKQEETITSSTSPNIVNSTRTIVAARPSSELSSQSLNCDWSPNKVKIYDDLALVASEEYTDIHRTEVTLTDVGGFRQYLRTAIVQDYEQQYLQSDLIGTLACETRMLPGYHYNVSSAGDDIDSPDGQGKGKVVLGGSLKFEHYGNCILKVEFSKTINQSSSHPVDNAATRSMPDVGYFLYGGVKTNQMWDTGFNVGIPWDNVPLNLDMKDDAKNMFSFGQSLWKHLDGKILGYYYLVPGQYTGKDYDIKNGLRVYPWEDDSVENHEIRNGMIGIQIEWRNNLSIDNRTEVAFPFTYASQGYDSIRYQTINARLTMIKFQPVVKCGKVDVYTKKRGIIAALLDSNYDEITPAEFPKFPPVGGQAADTNIFSSANHGLKTNDIVEISDALLDYDSHIGVADTHPLNGTKYVKVITDDIFELYYDKFFKDPATTVNLRTVDGVTWKCISNNFDSIGQSWDYYGSLFSPTGRNGYKFVDPSVEDTSDSLASDDEFITTKRPSLRDLIDDSGEVKLDFDNPSHVINYSNFAERLDRGIPLSFGYPIIPDPFSTPDNFYNYPDPNGDLEESFDTPLNDLKLGFWDFYPYYGSDDSYWGTRFGCDLDIKFSHMSGNSRVYTLAIGERGSDFSVDVFGVNRTESPFDVPSYVRSGFLDPVTNRESIYPFYGKRIPPWSLPNGKTHLLTITVDRYNKISDVSHKNTLYGGGKSIVDNSNYDSAREPNPWDQYLSDTRTFYKQSCFHVPNRNVASQFKSDDILIFGDPTISEYDDTASVQYNSDYWTRSAVVHWVGKSIYTYKRDSSEVGGFLREISSDHTRPTAVVQTDGRNNASRFGSVGFGGLAIPYARIDRLGIINSPVFDDPLVGFERGDSSDSRYRFIYPWVDSFGKSVALENRTGLTSVTGYSDSDPKTIVLSASTCRSNIEYNPNINVLTNTDDDGVPREDDGSLLLPEDSDSQIGQIQANFVYSDGSTYTNIDHIYINSAGGDCDRLYTNLTTRTEPDSNWVNVIDVGPKRALKTGSLAGYGMAEVIASCKLSASSIEWVGDKIIWTDQNLYSATSSVNILEFNDGFSVGSTIGKSFIDPRGSSIFSGLPSATNTGDGFGIDFCYEDGIFVTNARSKTTELGEDISYTIDGSPKDRLDYVYVYEKLTDAYDETQKISATIDKNEEDKYSLYLLNNENALLDIDGSASYGNNAVNTLTWNIDFQGRYDLINNKILIKDPLEYSLFSRNYSVSNIDNSSSISSEDAQVYLSFNEDVETSVSRYFLSAGDSVISLPMLSHSYNSQAVTDFRCVNEVRYSSSVSKTPVFFCKLPINNLDTLESFTIAFSMPRSSILSFFDLNGTVNLSDRPNNIIPRVVIYGKDPRLTVIENGPADTGSNHNQYPHYSNGLWEELPNKNNTGSLFSYQFPGWYRGGAQDLFFYGRIPGDRVKTGTVSLPGNPPSFLYGGEKNLGEYYDLTAGSRSDHRGGTAGDPAWISPDVFHELTEIEKQSILPYAKIYKPLNFTSGPGVDDSINYSISISKDDLKKFIIKDDLTNNTGRTTAITRYDPPDDTIVALAAQDDRYNDSANKYPNVENIDYSIIVGFVLTNVESFDLNTSTITHEEPSAQFDIGAISYILEQQDEFQYVNARYPYCPEALFYDRSFEGNKYNGKYLHYRLNATVRNPTFSITKKTHSQKRYSNKFSKIAVFRYDQDAMYDAKGSSNYSTPRDLLYNVNDVLEFKKFGVDKFIPAPSTSNQNPIISIGRKSNAFPFVDDNEVLAVEDVTYSNSSYSIDPESGDLEYLITPTGNPIGDFVFNKQSLLGGFDLDKDRFLSLTINPIPLEKAGIKLFTYGVGADNLNADMYISGIAGSNNNVDLFIEPNEQQNFADLFIYPPEQDNMSLFIYEPVPSGTATLFTDAPDFDGDIPLVMAKPPTGVVPLNIRGPLSFNSGIPLVRVPEVSGVMTNYIDGIGVTSGVAPLFVDSVFGFNNLMPLTFSPGVSGDISLFLARNLESSGDMPLVMPNVFDVHNTGIPLWIARNGDKNDADLFIKSQRYHNSDADLYINSQIENNSDVSLNVIGPVADNENTDLFLKVALPDSGSMDLNMPVVGLPTGIMSLHINQGYETMPLFTPIVENPAIPLYINGVALDDNKSVDLFLKSQYAVSDFDMVVKPIDYPSGDLSLNIVGSLDAGYSLGATLFIGKEINANGQVSLFTNNDVYAPSVGTTGFIAENTMAISGGLGAPYADDTTLFINVPAVGSGNQEGPLFLKVEEPVFGPGGGILSSGIIDLAVEGNNDAGVWIGSLKSNQAPLSMTAVEFSSGFAPLYIEQPEQANIPMYMASLINSGDIAVYITGANIGSGAMDLYISPPHAIGVDVFTRGYLE